jgi:3-oxoadipate enol-lactonase
MPGATVGDIEIHYERAGSGPPVLAIGGTGGDLRQRPNLLHSPLATSFEVLAYDQRGLGRTSVPPGPYTMADYADDAAGLLAALRWPRCAVVGVSFGGMVAQELAIRHPEVVDRLVLACTSSGGAGGASYPLHELVALAVEDPDAADRRQLALSDVRTDRDWQEAHPERAARLLADVAARREAGSGDPERVRGAALQLEARRHHDTWERLDRVACPVLVCAGRYDGIAPVANSEALVSRLPDASLHVFEGGHLFLLQDRAAWPAIVGFLGR